MKQKQKEKKIVEGFNAGKFHKQIIREYNIPAGHFYSIIRKTVVRK